MKINKMKLNVSTFLSPPLLALLFLLTVAGNVQAHDFGKMAETPDIPSPTDNLNNVNDGEAYRKSSVLESFRVGKENVGNPPKSFLLSLGSGRFNDDFVLSKKNVSGENAVYHFQQLYKKLKVFGGNIIVRVSPQNGGVVLTGYFFKNINTPIEPVFDVPSLVEKATRHLDGGTQKGASQLGILPADDGFHLCRKIRISKNREEDYMLYMDAITGKVLKAFNQVNTDR